MAKITVADVPHMLKMWDRKLNTEAPEDVAAKSTDPKYWTCPVCGYSWPASPKSRYRGKGQCPCHELNKVILKCVNDVLTIVKDLDKFIDEDNDFEQIYQQGLDSHLKVNFKCDECGRQWTAQLRTQIIKDENGGYKAAGCNHYNTTKRKKDEVPFCSEVEAIIKFWDDENPYDPYTTRSNLNKPAHFICKNCGYDWTTDIRTQGRYEKNVKCKCCERLLVPRKDYSDVFTLVPESKRFYDFEKNKDIDIYSLYIRDSKTMINWKCPEPDCGKEWQATLADRIKGKKGEYRFVGCQDCYLHSKERITPVAAIPKLLKQWDFKKNREKGIDPNLTSAYADIPAHWKCKKCDYEWEANIGTRMDSNGKCPYCEGNSKPVRTGINDVLTLCPKLADIYDFDYNAELGIDIYKESIYSKKRAHFKCKKCDHEWDSSIENRVKKKADDTYDIADCPECSNGNHRQIPYSVEYPLLDQMYRYDLNPIPLDSIKGRKAVCEDKYYWTCLVCNETFDSSLESMLNSQKTQTKGCPYCARIRLRKGESFADLHPELMDEYAPTNTIDPYTVFPSNKTYVDWICRDCKHKWPASFAQRHFGGGICPTCNRLILIPDKNSFAAVYPDYVQYWADTNERKSNEVYFNSTDWFKFICPVCHQEHGGRIEDFIAGNSCPYCKGIRLSPETNSLKALYPELAKRWSPNNNFGPEMILPTSCVRVKWICNNCNGEYGASVKDVVNGIAECPCATGKRAIPGKTSLKALYPDIAKLLSPDDGHDPDYILPTYRSPLLWRCTEYGLDYYASAEEMINGYTCPYCDGRRAVPGKTSLKALYPDIAKLLSPDDDHDPDYILPTKNTSYIWRCPKCNYDYNAPVNEMVDGYTCPYCNDRKVKTGFNSFADKHPDLLSEMEPIANYLLPISPYEVLDTSNKKFWFICKRNPKHKYPMSPRNRLMFQKRSKEPCLYCRGQRRKLNRFVKRKKKKTVVT